MQLRVPPAPPLKPPLSERDHVLGLSDAKIAVVEYGDYQCPHCRIATRVVDEIRNRYGNDLRFAFRHFPLAKIHPQARIAAEAAEAAAAQGKFWEMHATIFRNAKGIDAEHLVGYARDLGLDSDRMKADLETHAYAPRVQEDVASAVRSGVNATPTFFLNGFRHNGGYEITGLTSAIDKLMSGDSPAPPII